MRGTVWVMLGAAVIHSLGWAGPVVAQEVWLEKGAVSLTLPDGEQVDLEEGNYLNCNIEGEETQEDTDGAPCQIIPLALAPALPSGATIGALGSVGGLAGAPLAASTLTVIGPVVGVSVGAAIAAGVAATVVGGTSTPTTTPNTN